MCIHRHSVHAMQYMYIYIFIYTDASPAGCGFEVSKLHGNNCGD